MVKNLPVIQETQETKVRSLSWEDPLEKGMATHSSILAWRISQRVAWWALVGYSPWFHKKSGTTERLTLLLFLMNVGKKKKMMEFPNLTICSNRIFSELGVTLTHYIS